MAMGFDPYSAASYAGLPPVDWSGIDPRLRSPMATKGELKSYTPGIVTQFADWLNQNLYGDTKEGLRPATALANTLGYTVGAIPVGAYEGFRAGAEGVQQGDLEGVQTELAMAALPPKVKTPIREAKAALRAAATAPGSVATREAKEGRSRALEAFQETVRQEAGGGQLAGPHMYDVAEAGQFMRPEELPDMYKVTGLLGREPSEFAKPALREHTDEATEQARVRKVEDLDWERKLTKRERELYRMEDKDAKTLSEKEKKIRNALEPPSKTAEDIKYGAERTALEKQRASIEKKYGTPSGELNFPFPPMFDLSPMALNRIPDVEQFPLPRAGFVYPKGLLSPEDLPPQFATAPERWEAAIKHGGPRATGWYGGMDQLQRMFHDVMGPERGEQAWQMYVQSLGGTSMVNPVPSNIRTASYMLGQGVKGERLPERLDVENPFYQGPGTGTGSKMVKTLVGDLPPPYGAKARVEHARRTREFVGSKYKPEKNPKPLSYQTNIAGNWDPRTSDTHDIRIALGAVMPEKSVRAAMERGETSPLWMEQIDPADIPANWTLPQYQAIEQQSGRHAAEMGLTPAQHQAGTWIGGGFMTGLKSPPIPLLEEHQNRIFETALIRGISPQEVIQRLLTRGEPLL